MQLVGKSSKTQRTQCYIHEMRAPLDLPYERHKYHICLICRARLLELARVDFQYRRDENIITISAVPEGQKEPA